MKLSQALAQLLIDEQIELFTAHGFPELLEEYRAKSTMISNTATTWIKAGIVEVNGTDKWKRYKVIDWERLKEIANGAEKVSRTFQQTKREKMIKSGLDNLQECWK